MRAVVDGGEAADDVALEQGGVVDGGGGVDDAEVAPRGVLAAVGGEAEGGAVAAMKASWRASFSGRQRSSASRKAMKRPRAARMARLRAAAGPSP